MRRSILLWSLATVADVSAQGLTSPGPTDMGRKLSKVLDKIIAERNLAPTPSPKKNMIRLRMSDGTGLHTRYSLPYPYDQKRAAVLERTPYGIAIQCDQFMALNGAAAVFQQQRGTFLSQGKFDAWRHDAQDAYDTIEWIVSQPWSNGEVYTVGISAEGIGEVLLAITPNSHLKAQWVAWSPSNGHSFGYPGGAYRQDLTEGYMKFMRLPTRGASTGHVVPDIKSHEGWDADYYHNITVCRNASEPASEHCHYSTLSWPVVDSAGWYDIFGSQQVEQFLARRQLSDSRIRDRHVLIVDPLGHCSLAAKQLPGLMQANGASMTVAAELASEMFAGVFDGPVRSKLGRVNLYVMRDFAGNTTGSFWTSLDEFPTPKGEALFFGSDGKLSNEPPQTASALDYMYDPQNPTPMLGGNNLPGVGAIKDCGPVDQLERETRSDVLVFDGDELEADLPIVGQMRVKLFVSSSAADTDFVVTVSDFSGKVSMLVCHGVQRMRWRLGDAVKSPSMTKDQVYEVTFNLDAVAYIFPKGHRIRIGVASAAAPFYNANANTGIFEDKTTVRAINSVHLAPEYQSQVWMPVVAIEDLPENTHTFGQAAVELTMV